MSFLPFLGNIASAILGNKNVQQGFGDLISETQKGLSSGGGFFPALGRGLKKGFSTLLGIDDQNNVAAKLNPTANVFQIQNASDASKVFKNQLNNYADSIEEDRGAPPTKKELQEFKKIITSEDTNDYLPYIGDDQNLLNKKIDWAIDYFMKKDIAPSENKYPRNLRFKKPFRITV